MGVILSPAQIQNLHLEETLYEMAAKEVEQNWPPTATVQETSKTWLQVRNVNITLKYVNNFKYDIVIFL